MWETIRIVLLVLLGLPTALVLLYIAARLWGHGYTSGKHQAEEESKNGE